MQSKIKETLVHLSRFKVFMCMFAGLSLNSMTPQSGSYELESSVLVHLMPVLCV